ncbi:sensor histidine kinase [Photobacterium frigidiphilum]|uniref:sensor histidine kinase n=1 Tax=Photobacterium frigidiphilum TaxID=264736 RepID=UPI0030013E99
MDMLTVFSIYLLYGLAFLAIGFSIVFRNYKNSQISISKLLPTLAIFGFIHGIHEWSELYLTLYDHEYTHSRNIEIFKVIKLWFSYLALGAFGWKMLDLIQWRFEKFVKLFIVFLLIAFIYSLFARYDSQSFQGYVSTTAAHVRWLFGFGAGLLAGVTMVIYAKQLLEEGHNASSPFTFTGIAMICYAFSAGLLFSELGIWVIFLRTLCAIAILVFLWKALHVFDIEREQQIEAVLQRAFQDTKLKELGGLTSAVSHEIKTPLSSALMSCDLLEKRLPNDENANRQLERIRSGIERAAHISQEVLNYAHQRKMKASTVNVLALASSATNLIQYRLASFDVIIDIDPDLTVYGDNVQLEEVIINLLANAIDACHEKKGIHISARIKGVKVIIDILDSGQGIPENIIEKAVQPFFTTKAVGEGTGMGLAICRQILMQHNGDLILSNTQTGLNVQIILPKAIE